MDHKGWHSRGYLPHFDSQDVVQFVTFRLADSLPKVAALRLRAAAQPESLRDELLDRGWGACWLKDERVAEIVEQAFLTFDGERYRMHAWTIMPNHVHVLLSVLPGTNRWLLEALHGPHSKPGTGSRRRILASRLLGSLHPTRGTLFLDGELHRSQSGQSRLGRRTSFMALGQCSTAMKTRHWSGALPAKTLQGHFSSLATSPAIRRLPFSFMCQVT
jgi:hypothetical protein